MPVRFRLMTRDDIPAGMRLKDAAGWNQTVADWERLLAMTPQGCFAAERDGQLVGTVTTIVYEDKVAWIGMVMVEPQHRGQGIGTALLERAIRYLDGRGIPSIKLDATPQGRPLYERLGFVSEYAIERWMLRREYGASTAPSPVEIDDALHVDRDIFGADRTELLRTVAVEAPELALVARQSTAIAGYAFGRRGSRADQLGPWMGQTREIAETLLDDFLRRSGRALVFVDCVRPNPWAVSLVQARRFEFSRPLTRMYRGTNRYAGRPELLCAVLGPEFG